MGNIHILPESVSTKISAGEVVQRPASVVKELLENAIDSGADEITLIIKESGRSLVQVIDNGCGMTVEDAKLSFERFATSKVSSVDDLENLRTLGFRGEALASIAAVAQVEMKTRRLDDTTGTLIKIEGGKFLEVTKTQAAGGTSIAVRNIFFNVPARRKFLKTNATEFKHIFEIAQAIALGYPDVKMSFISEDEEVFGFKQAGIEERLNHFFGGNFFETLIPIAETNDFLSVSGYVGKPTMTKRVKNEQLLFINQRIVQSKAINFAVYNAYGQLMGEREYPFFCLYVKIDPSHIDVNVHPTKMEVKFDDERSVCSMISSVVRKAVSDIDFSPSVEMTPKPTSESPLEFSESPRAYSPVARLRQEDVPTGRARTTENLFHDYKESIARREGVSLREVEAKSDDIAQTPKVFYQESRDTDMKKVEERQIWQLHNKYILSQIKTGIMIIDQHVAHERILYERALQLMDTNIPNAQQLLFPHKVELAPWEYEIFKEIQADLERLGFALKFFGGKTIVIEGVPPDVRAGTEEKVLQQILEQYKTYHDTLGLEVRDNIAKSYACRSAIMAGDKLSVREMNILIDQLFATKMPYVCPHGRPIIIKLSLEELDKMFGRT